MDRQFVQAAQVEDIFPIEVRRAFIEPLITGLVRTLPFCLFADESSIAFENWKFASTVSPFW